MGIETQAVLVGHHNMGDLYQRLQAYGATEIHPRVTHRPDYQMIQFVDLDGELRVVNVFLNSFASEDYQELSAGESTLITMELGPTSKAVVRAIASLSPGWFRQQDTEAWVHHSVS